MFISEHAFIYMYLQPVILVTLSIASEGIIEKSWIQFWASLSVFKFCFKMHFWNSPVFLSVNFTAEEKMVLSLNVNFLTSNLFQIDIGYLIIVQRPRKISQPLHLTNSYIVLATCNLQFLRFSEEWPWYDIQHNKKPINKQFLLSNFFLFSSLSSFSMQYQFWKHPLHFKKSHK